MTAKDCYCFLCYGPKVTSFPMLDQSSVKLTADSAVLEVPTDFRMGCPYPVSWSPHTHHETHKKVLKLPCLCFLIWERTGWQWLCGSPIEDGIFTKSYGWKECSLACQSQLSTEDNLEQRPAEPATLICQLTPGHGRMIPHNQASSPGSWMGLADIWNLPSVIGVYWAFTMCWVHICFPAKV